jgi:hypothetical protein
MKSFRLDYSSISEFKPFFSVTFVCVLLSLLLAHVGLLQPVMKITLLFAGAYVGFILFRGTLFNRLRQQYPNARLLTLLVIGTVAFFIGALYRIGFSEFQANTFDRVWIITSLACILTFVIINRGDSDIVQ